MKYWGQEQQTGRLCEIYCTCFWKTWLFRGICVWSSFRKEFSCTYQAVLPLRWNLYIPMEGQIWTEVCLSWISKNSDESFLTRNDICKLSGISELGWHVFFHFQAIQADRKASEWGNCITIRQTDRSKLILPIKDVLVSSFWFSSVHFWSCCIPTWK